MPGMRHRTLLQLVLTESSANSPPFDGYVGTSAVHPTAQECRVGSAEHTPCPLDKFSAVGRPLRFEASMPVLRRAARVSTPGATRRGATDERTFPAVGSACCRPEVNLGSPSLHEASKLKTNMPRLTTEDDGSSHAQRGAIQSSHLLAVLARHGAVHGLARLRRGYGTTLSPRCDVSSHPHGTVSKAPHPLDTVRCSKCASDFWNRIVVMAVLRADTDSSL